MTPEQLAISVADAALAERRTKRDDGVSAKEYWAALAKFRAALDAYERAKVQS